MRSNRRRNVFWITLRRLGRRQARNYCSATLLDFCARSRSITARQPVLRLARFFIMQAVTHSTMADIGGPIDWVLGLLVFAVGAVGTTMLAYLAQRALGAAKPA